MPHRNIYSWNPSLTFLTFLNLPQEPGSLVPHVFRTLQRNTLLHVLLCQGSALMVEGGTIFSEAIIYIKCKKTFRNKRSVIWFCYLHLAKEYIGRNGSQRQF